MKIGRTIHCTGTKALEDGVCAVCCRSRLESAGVLVHGADDPLALAFVAYEADYPLDRLCRGDVTLEAWPAVADAMRDGRGSRTALTHFFLPSDIPDQLECMARVIYDWLLIREGDLALLPDATDVGVLVTVPDAACDLPPVDGSPALDLFVLVNFFDHGERHLLPRPGVIPPEAIKDE